MVFVCPHCNKFKSDAYEEVGHHIEICSKRPDKKPIEIKVQVIRHLFTNENKSFYLARREVGGGNYLIIGCELWRQLATGSPYKMHLTLCELADFSIGLLDAIIWEKSVKEQICTDLHHIAGGKSLRRGTDGYCFVQGSGDDISIVRDDAALASLEQVVRRIPYYEVSAPLSLGELRALSNDIISDAMEVYSCGGAALDVRIKLMAHMGVPRMADPLANARFARNMPHAIIVKNTKAGVSTLAQRIGKNFEAVSNKSFEGYATADQTICNSVLHGAAGLVNFDEFLTLEDSIFSKLFGMAESGQYLAGKASQEIKSFACPLLCFTTNPPELSGDGDAYTPLSETFVGVMRKLTKVPGAAGSRVGYVVFNDKLAVVSPSHSVQEAEAAEQIAKSVIFHTGALLVPVFREAELAGYFEQPLDEYDKAIDKHFETRFEFDRVVRRFWEGQKEARRHIRGGGLLLAFYDALPSIVKNGSASFETLKDAAEKKTQDICQINLESLDKTLDILSASKSEKIIRFELENTSAYVKAYLVGWARIGRGGVVSKAEILEAWASLPDVEKDRIAGGAYRYPAQLDQRLNFKGLRGLGETAGFDVLSDLSISGSQELSKLILEIFDAKSAKLLNNTNTTDDKQTLSKHLANLANQKKDLAGRGTDDKKTLSISKLSRGFGDLRFLKDVPAWVGADDITYGAFNVGDTAKLPTIEAEFLVKSGLAELIDDNAVNSEVKT